MQTDTGRQTERRVSRQACKQTQAGRQKDEYPDRHAKQTQAGRQKDEYPDRHANRETDKTKQVMRRYCGLSPISSMLDQSRKHYSQNNSARTRQPKGNPTAPPKKRKLAVNFVSTLSRRRNKVNKLRRRGFRIKSARPGRSGASNSPGQSQTRVNRRTQQNHIQRSTVVFRFSCVQDTSKGRFYRRLFV